MNEEQAPEDAYQREKKEVEKKGNLTNMKIK